MSANTEAYFANLDKLIASKPAQEIAILRTQLDGWNQRAATAERWAAKGAGGNCPIPAGWTVFDIAAIQNELETRLAKLQVAA